jgi:two-component system, NtrC family, nitrogen regulation sensor histidine kinase NtrY
MVFRNFRLNISLRTVALSLSIALEIWLLSSTTFYLTASVVAFVIVAEVVFMIRFVERTNDIVTRYFQSAKHGDVLSTASLRRQGKSFDRLFTVLDDMLGEFHRARSLTEEHFQSLQTVIQHVGFGLLSFRQDGEIGLMNGAAKRLLQTHQLANIRSLAGRDASLVDKLLQLKSGDKVLVRFDRDGEILQLAMHATEYRLGEHHYTMVSLQNIGAELEEKEMEAWQNLIRVLTHEIMNSITPISSLASTVNQLLKAEPGNAGGELSVETMNDIRAAVGTIEKRSQGLLHFVDAYRHLTHIPRPAFRQCLITELFSRVHTLMQSQLEEAHITLTADTQPDNLELSIDPDLVEQVLINLIRNAIQSMSCQSEKQLALLARIDETGRVWIEVSDNGPGIPQEIQQRIFIPFFTTKEDGSGIGLSLSRQIMRLHGGTITCRSREGQGTTFALRF